MFRSPPPPTLTLVVNNRKWREEKSANQNHFLLPPFRNVERGTTKIHYPDCDRRNLVCGTVRTCFGILVDGYRFPPISYVNKYFLASLIAPIFRESILVEFVLDGPENLSHETFNELVDLD